MEVVTLYLNDSRGLRLSNRLVIFSDCKLALEAIKNGDTNITSVINILLESLYCKGKLYDIELISPYVNIEEEVHDYDQPGNTFTFAYANATEKFKILPYIFKKPLVPNFNCLRILTFVIARLRVNHFRRMQILPHKAKRYVPCIDCLDVNLTSRHIFKCSALAPYVLKIGNNATGRQSRRCSLQLRGAGAGGRYRLEF